MIATAQPIVESDLFEQADLPPIDQYILAYVGSDESLMPVETHPPIPSVDDPAVMLRRLFTRQEVA
jgi:hypothetical protein